MSQKQNEHIKHLFRKYELIAKEDTDWEEFNTEDAEVILVAFGSMTRNIKAAMKVLRSEGIRAGAFRPITLSPFPNKRLNQLADKTDLFTVVEMNMGQMITDVKLAINGKAQVDLINRPVGQWLSVEEIVSEVKNILNSRGKVHASV